MQKVVVDSDIIIDHLRNYSNTLETLLYLASEKQIELYVPSVVVTEIHSGQDTKKNIASVIKELLERLEFIHANKEISEHAGVLLRDHAYLSLGDAIIAATALSIRAKLITRNKKDFQGIKGIKFFNLE